MKLKKGSAAAKAFMAKLRAAKGKPKKVGAAKKKTLKSMISKYKYIIQDSEAGNFIDKYITLNEAKKALLKFETQDKKEGIYKPYFYEIKNLNNKNIVGAVKKVAKKKVYKQTGGSILLYDKRFQALKPGKRKTANPHKYRGKTIKKSTTYTEKRADRSDKGRLLGISKICGLPNYKDPIAAREIELYATNDNDLYRQQRRPILINLSKKHKKGLYKIELAAKLWRYFIDSALQKYNKDFGSRGDKWYEILSTSDRQLLAEEFAKETKDEFDLGNYTEK